MDGTGGLDWSIFFKLDRAEIDNYFDASFLLLTRNTVHDFEASAYKYISCECLVGIQTIPNSRSTGTDVVALSLNSVCYICSFTWTLSY